MNSGRKRWLMPLAAGFAGLALILIALSFFLDPIVRTRVERNLNASLKGYRARVGGAHLRLLDGTLILRDVTLIQEAHPQPPVGELPQLSIDIEWRDLLTWHVVADLYAFHPKLHFDLTQLRSERANKVPLSKEGWQDAIESIYPFKINHFTIDDGDITYVDTDPNRPLRLEHLYIAASNIRNTRPTSNSYPSTIQAEATVFEVGQASINGHANFLTKPFASVAASYHLKNVPLMQLKPVLGHVNIDVEGGTFASDGFVEYGPKATKIAVYEARIAGGRFDYTHAALTAAAETHRVAAVKAQGEKINNAPETQIQIAKLIIIDSEFGYTDAAADPHYRIFISHLTLSVTNLSNHFSQGPTHVSLRGLFMGSGVTTVSGEFRPEKPGSDFDLNIAIRGTNLPSLNNLFRAYGRFDVAAGELSVYAQVTVRRGEMTGYVKPLFSNVKVYDARKDQNKSLPHKIYEHAVGLAAKVFTNSSTQKAATQVNLAGKLDSPDVSDWQALVEFLHNAFVKAILPGFDQQTKFATASKE
jgi:hypothetical protein